ncbi:hypothetical protein [Pedobacter miscanthi]|uniref:Uncharacterized protein n=1 Tax=Pedobacter miscanthi TaxID=2259170 RepID=A0A366L4W1_9SPHI|nr:hypothetical protein [Pedobacter miscanthi]RBQ08921.1 hypothetical protein DRW42_06850 [Pedobacter miscanthi]
MQYPQKNITEAKNQQDDHPFDNDEKNLSNTITARYPENGTLERKNPSNRSRKTSAEKQLPKRCTAEELDKIRIGDHILTADGTKGVIADIEVKKKNSEKHYYFRLQHGKTLLYII